MIFPLAFRVRRFADQIAAARSIWGWKAWVKIPRVDFRALGRGKRLRAAMPGIDVRGNHWEDLLSVGFVNHGLFGVLIGPRSMRRWSHSEGLDSY